MPAAYDSKYINDIEIKFDGVVENHELINLEFLNWHMMSSLHHNDVITVKILDF